MRDIRVYDFEFNLLCIMTDVISSQWHILYNDVGAYEGHFRLNDRISDVILSNRYIVLTQGDLQAVCTGRIVEDKLTVCGRTVNWLLTKRVCPPFSTRDVFGEEYTDAETILFHCLKKGFTEPPQIGDDGKEKENTIDENKKVTNFMIPDAAGAEKLDAHFWRNTANTVEDICHDLCEKLDRGHRLVFDIENKCWRFEFIYPSLNKIIIAKEAKTAYEFSYSEDMQNLACGGWYVNENEETGQTVWRYLKNKENNGIYAWDCVLQGNGESEAEDKLAEKIVSGNIRSRLKNLKYGTDYALGDIMQIYFSFGGFERTEYYKVCGVDIKMTCTDNYEEPILKQCKKSSGIL